jgi:hypothetical protein
MYIVRWYPQYASSMRLCIQAVRSKHKGKRIAGSCRPAVGFRLDSRMSIWMQESHRCIIAIPYPSLEVQQSNPPNWNVLSRN